MSTAILIGIDELALRLGTTPGAIRNARYRGTPSPPAIKIGRSLRWDPADVDRWIDEHKERRR